MLKFYFNKLLTFFAYFFSLLIFLFAFSSVSYGQSALNFNDTTPALETGSALSAGARYRFENVAPSTDCLVTIVSLNGGATVALLDDNDSFPERFQPQIRTTAANTTGWVRFDFQLVAAGTSTPRAVPGVRISAQDIDAQPVREFVEFVNTQTVSVNSPTFLVSLSALAGGTRYGYRNFTEFQSGIGTDNRYEMYTSIADTATTFTIIGGNQVGSSNCTGSGDTCSRRHSYAFDPVSSNVTNPNPDVSITKTGPASVNQNATVTYSLVARNNGATTAHGSTITDNVPSGLTGVTISCVATNSAVCPSTTGLTTLSNVFIATFPVNGQLTFTISGTASTTSTITNVATIAPPNGSTDPDTTNNTSATITTIINLPDLQLAKSHTGNFTVGSNGTYSFTVANSGTAPSSGTITISDLLPVGLTVNSGAAGTVTDSGTNAANWSCSSNALTGTPARQTITCTGTTAIPRTAGSNTSVFNFAVNVGLGTAVGTNSITNTASVSGGGESNTSNNSASDPTTVLSPDLTISKAHSPATFVRGSTGTYNLTVNNISTATANTSGTITVVDTLPTGLSITDGSVNLSGTNAGSWSCNAASNVITCNTVAGTVLAIGNSSIFGFDVNVSSTAATPVVNLATVTGGNEATARNDSSNIANDSTPTAAATYSIGGKVFEDVNYGGGVGRNLTTSSGVVRQNARVELYNSSGNFVSFTLTNLTGDYSFTGLSAGNYTVRVVNSTVTSSRLGYISGLIPVQTFRTNASTGAAVAVTNRVGGETPSLIDAVNGSTTLAALTTATTTAQSITAVTIGTANVTGADFGFNFSTIVNISDSGQGSLRQFILNSNALLNSGLTQSGSTINTRGANSSLPSGRESSIFMISGGTVRPGLRNGLANQLTSGVAVIQVASTLPAITDADTIIDGGTQTFNITNTNSTTLNSASTVGIDGLSVPALGGPEIQIQPTSTFFSNAVSGITLNATATNTTIQNISILGFTAASGTDQGNIYLVSGSSAMIRWNVIGSSATSYTDPGASARTADYGVLSNTGNLTLRENIVAFVGAGGFELFNASSSTLVEANELRGNAIVNSSAENLNIQVGGSNAVVRGNLSVNAGGPGFDTSGSTGGNIFENNTVTGNGTLTNGQTSGLRIQGSNNTIRKNIIGNNYGAGILVRYATTNTGNVITQNSIFANGTTGGSPSKQIGIDLVATASESGNTGTFPFVTVNDANDADSGPNDLLNFPVFESVTVSGSNLVLRGCAPSGATIEFFESDVSFGKSSTPGANTNTPRTLDYGEGETYLGTLTEGGVGDSDSGSGCPATDGNNQTGMARFSFTIPLPAGVISGDLLTATATVSGVGTSEFSPVSPVAAAVPNVSLLKSCPSPSDCTTSPQLPETDITYRIDFTNSGGQGASNLRIVDGIPDKMDYKISSATSTSGITFTIEFSADYDPATPTAATWTYTPVSGGGNATVGFASAGYDRLVKAIRWSANAAIPNTSPNNTGNVSFIAKIR